MIKDICHTVWKTRFNACLGMLLAALAVWGCAVPVGAQYRARMVSVPGQAVPGEFVRFGHYAQGGAGEVAPIDWVVLDKASHALLLLAVRTIECLPYNEAAAETTWSSSSLRRWLNEAFVAQAFSPAEQTLLLSIASKNAPNSVFGTLAGPDTEDRVTILSPQQVEYYIYAPQDRVCYASPYSVSRGAFVTENGVCWWWLRSPGSTALSAACVTCDGSLVMEGAPVNRSDGGVRPVIRIMI